MDKRCKRIQTLLLAVTGVLMGVLLLYLAVTPNVEVRQSRRAEGYEAVEEVAYREVEDASAPTGMVREFRFVLDEAIACDTSLIFKFSHQRAAVYLDGEEVYALTTSPAMPLVRTPGVSWAMIPLYREDAGKEVRVVLTPVYENYQSQDISFYLGSKLGVYADQLVSSLPEMLLSFVDVLAGLSLLGAAAYFSLHKVGGEGFSALGMLAVSLGLWNFTQTSFAPLIMQEKSVFIYYVSLVMLMASVAPLIQSIRISGKRFSGRLLRDWGLVCGVLCLGQLVIQLLGVLDLRQMLKVTHAMILVSALVLILSSFLEWRSIRMQEGKKREANGLWMLGLGAVLDMAVYYLRGGSSGLLFVLIAILCFVLKEGIGLFFSYMRQKQELEEKEIQLTLSRTAAMMSQIRSHFVFNILNAISGMCKYDPEKADETVVRFARYLRNNIDMMEDDKPLLFSTELGRLEDYVVLEQVRFGDKITFLADIQAEDFTIPPLILQPVVENAIKHGISKKQTGGTVTLRTWEEGASIKISVTDDGVGFDLAELEKSSSVGLKNIRYRLRHLVDGTLDIDSRVGQGTTVTITIPKKES